MLCAEDIAGQADHVEARACHFLRFDLLTLLFTEHFVNTEMKVRTDFGCFRVFKQACCGFKGRLKMTIGQAILFWV